MSFGKYENVSELPFVQKTLGEGSEITHQLKDLLDAIMQVQNMQGKQIEETFEFLAKEFQGLLDVMQDLTSSTKK